MNRSMRRACALVAGLVLALPASQTLHASAADTGPDFDDVAATGTTTFTPGVPLLGGTGTWQFVSSGPCAELSGGVEVSTTEIVEAGVSCSITGSGTYSNIVCGFMTMVGTYSVTLNVTVPFSATETWTTNFAATIGYFQGPIQGTSVEGLTSDGDTDNGTAWPTTGQISLTPTAGIPCMSQAFTQLSLSVAEPDNLP